MYSVLISMPMVPPELCFTTRWCPEGARLASGASVPEGVWRMGGRGGGEGHGVQGWGRRVQVVWVPLLGGT